MRIILIFLAFLLVAKCDLPRQHPVIGVYTQSLDSNEPTSQNQQRKVFASHNKTYIAASYVKFIEMSGAHVIPIFAFNDKSYFDEILPKINGVLFPGGDMQININNKWTQNSEYIMKYAINQTKKGNPFPIWGTCQGMQQIAYLTSGYDLKAVAPVRGEVAVRNTIQITPENTLFKDLSKQLLNSLQSGVGILYFNHHFAVTREYFNSNIQLQNFWDVEAFTTTSFSQEFLSVFKAKQYPIYGVQFHPQKNLFQWKIYAERSQNGAQIVQILSNKFIEIARKNTNKFSSNQQLNRQSIFNYKSQKTDMNFVAIYVFNETITINTKPFSIESNLQNE